MDLQNCLNFQRELLNLPPTVTQWQTLHNVTETLQKRFQPKEICMQGKNNKREGRNQICKIKSYREKKEQKKQQ